MGELLAPEHREKTGALLRHEVCFALGEINERAAVLKERLEQVNKIFNLNLSFLNLL